MAKSLYKFELGQDVYIVHDAEQYKRMVVYQMTTFGGYVYGIACAGEIIDCFEEELSLTKNVI